MGHAVVVENGTCSGSDGEGYVRTGGESDGKGRSVSDGGGSGRELRTALPGELSTIESSTTTVPNTPLPMPPNPNPKLPPPLSCMLVSLTLNGLADELYLCKSMEAGVAGRART